VLMNSATTTFICADPFVRYKDVVFMHYYSLANFGFVDTVFLSKASLV